MPPELEILRVTDASSSKMWVDTINRGFGMKGAMANTVSAWARGARDDGRWVRFVGLVDGQPVSTSGVYLLGGVAGVAQVTTVPEFRRRGIGEAVTAAAVECARLAGYRIAVLGASPMVRSMYMRMGFREVGRLKTLFPEGVGVAPRARMAGPSR